MPTSDEQLDVGFGGIKVFEFCDGLIQSAESFWGFLQAFIGGGGMDPKKPYFGSHVPEYMKKQNLKFLEVGM
jgi:hypothetical protein